MFKECYALEKIHGTSAFITYNPQNNLIALFSGGTSHELFKSLFNLLDLNAKFQILGIPHDKTITVFGESYGGKEQGMSETYGKVPKFIAFDVMIGDVWLNVPLAEQMVKNLGLEFVHYVKVSTDLAFLDAQRDAPSIQAIRNGITTVTIINERKDVRIDNGKPREGVVLRPLIELTMNNGHRLMAKHKGEKFQETATPRPVVDPEKLKVLTDAEAVANEWVVVTRLEHILQKIPDHSTEKMREILNAMIEDVLREGLGEIVDSQPVRKAICTRTAVLYKQYLQNALHKSG